MASTISYILPIGTHVMPTRGGRTENEVELTEQINLDYGLHTQYANHPLVAKGYHYLDYVTTGYKGFYYWCEDAVRIEFRI